MMKETVISRSVRLALAGGIAVGFGLIAQPVLAEEKIQKVEVVGSNIKRADVEGPSPVLVVTKEDIAKTGATSVNDLLRSMSVSLGSFDDQNNNSNAPSTAAASLRGLGPDNTLVLLNGRRLAPHGMAQGTSNNDVTFVDLNSLPISAIAQVQVLKDGASAIYGSDAIAGVINIITKKDYQGVEAKATVGGTSDGGGNERGTAITAGWGDLQNDGWNLLGTFDFYHKDSISYKQRSLTASADLRKYGGPDKRSGISNFGTFQDTHADPNADNNVYLPNCPTQFIRGICRWEPSDAEGLQPKSDKTSLMGVFTKQLTPDMRFGLEAMYSKNESHYTVRSPAIDFGVNQDVTQQAADYLGLDYTTLRDQVRTKLLQEFKAKYPGITVDPTANGMVVLTRATEIGPRDYEATNKVSRLVANLSGTVRDFDWEAAVGRAKSDALQAYPNELRADKLVLGVLDGSIDLVSYPKTGLDSAKYAAWRKSTYTVTFADGKLSGELMPMLAGKLGFAAGVEFRKEELNDNSDPLTVANLAIGSGAVTSQGTRNASAAYVEFSVPVLKELEAQVALRTDHYSDFGNTTNPKLALRYQPMKSLVLRGSYSTSFRAPSLFQLAKKVSSPDYQELVDTPRCAVTNLPQDCDSILRAVRADGANSTGTTLKPEKGTATNFGIVFEPTSNSNMSFDLWHIKKSDAIEQADAQSILDQNLTPYIVRNASGALDYVIASYRNLGKLDVKGVDIDGTARFPLGEGRRFTLSGSATYLIRYAVQEAGDPNAIDYVGNWPNSGGGIPRIRGQIRGVYDMGPWSATLAGNYTHRYWDYQRVGTHDLSSFWTYDGQIGYNGIKNLELRLGARNLFDRAPPMSFASYVPFDGSVASAKGRFWYLTANYKFK